jgi:hypothetical protein
MNKKLYNEYFEDDEEEEELEEEEYTDEDAEEQPNFNDLAIIENED